MSPPKAMMMRKKMTIGLQSLAVVKPLIGSVIYQRGSSHQVEGFKEEQEAAPNPLYNRAEKADCSYYLNASIHCRCVARFLQD
ncbi:hypothetical protein ABKV19_013770 [Rosa sericea]